MVVGGQGNWRCFIQGVDVPYLEIRDWSVASGRGLDAADVRARRKVCLIGKTVADQLFPEEDPVGQQVRLRDVPFTIVGLLVAKGQTAGGNDQDDVIIAPWTTVKERLAGRQFISQILAATHSPQDVIAAQAEIKAIMREAHKLAVYDDDDFQVRNQDEIAKAASGTTEVMTALLAAIAGISLLVGGIGIMNIMLVSVTERTREIGIRMAVGARPADVLWQFLVESVVLSVCGGILGVALGFGGAALIETLAGWQTLVTAPTVALALGFSVAVGVFFGFYPARRAAGLDPIVALRRE
jgi:putative ABC transport system permease protein